MSLLSVLHLGECSGSTFSPKPQNPYLWCSHVPVWLSLEKQLQCPCCGDMGCPEATALSGGAPMEGLSQGAALSGLVHFFHE